MRMPAQRMFAGFTLVEMMMSIGCGTFILAAVILAAVSLAKSYAALEGYSTAEANQLRVLDYITMDSRRATSGTVDTGSVVSGNWVHSSSGPITLYLTVPSYYTYSGSNISSAVPSAPTASGSAPNGTVSYGSGSVTIYYYQSGTNFIREVVSTSSPSYDTATRIATNVAAFTVTPPSASTYPYSVVNYVPCGITFFPTFLHNTGTGNWWSGQTTPDQAPSAGVGANGDWYVINPTATTASTIGNVYYKSNGAWSLVENERATTVYCNPFVRNTPHRP